jgi:hypothetical protein
VVLASATAAHIRKHKTNRKIGVRLRI